MAETAEDWLTLLSLPAAGHSQRGHISYTVDQGSKGECLKS